jgi:hypothetical protein
VLIGLLGDSPFGQPGDRMVPSDLPFGPAGSPSGWGFSVPMASYRASERWHPGKLDALAIYCSDGRWTTAFDEFCHRHLQTTRYDRWTVPGGPSWVALAVEDAELRHAVRVQLDFLVLVHELERVVLITHHGCAWYGHLLQGSPDECLPAQAEDMASAATALRGWYPGLRVEAYLAMRRQDWVSFHPLPTGEGVEARRTAQWPLQTRDKKTP